MPLEVHRAWNLRDKSATSTWHHTVRKLESKCMVLPSPPFSLLTEPLLQTRLTTSMVAEFQTQSAPGLAQPLQHPRRAKLGKTFLYLGLALPYRCSNCKKVKMLCSLRKCNPEMGKIFLFLFKVQGLNEGGVRKK